MPRLGLIAAMTQESAALLRQINSSERFKLGELSGRRFELSGQTCLLVNSGMGVRRASETAHNLVETAGVTTLISFGIAGAVEAELAIGDTILPEAVCWLEEGKPGPRLPLGTWSDGARQAMAQALTTRGAHLYTGTAVTTGGAQMVAYQPGELLHPILEMETAGIAQVAEQKGVPLLSIRAISDGPCAPIPYDMEEMMDEDANLRTGRLLLALLRQPKMLLQFNGMLQNTRIAADNAAAALVAALS